MGKERMRAAKILELFNKRPVAVFFLVAVLVGGGALVTSAALTFSGVGVTGDGAVSITAGGTDQNVTLTPSGSGIISLGGNVSISGTCSGCGILAANNLSDLQSTSTARLNLLGTGSTGQSLIYDGSNWIASTTSGGGGTPGGSDTQVQFNNAGAFGGSSSFTYNSGTKALFVSSTVAIGTSTLPASSTVVIGATNPQLDLKRLTGSKESWGLFNTGSALQFKLNNVAKHYMDTLNFVVGTTTLADSSGSQMLLYGGDNGANLDARGRAEAFKDQATFEAEGSDYGTTIKSIRIQYYGGANSGGTTAGYTNVNLGVLGWSEASTALILVSNDIPLHFNINNQKVMDVTSSGLIIGTTTTPAANLQVLKNSSSTIYVGNSTHSGCIVLGDSDGSGVTYITANGGTLAATTTKPAICQ